MLPFQLEAKDSLGASFTPIPPNKFGLFSSESMSAFVLNPPDPIPKLTNASLLFISKSLLATPYIVAKSLASPHPVSYTHLRAHET